MKKPHNRFHNLSLGQLADQFGELKAQMDALEKQADEIKDELKSRVRDVPAIGERYTVTKIESTQKRLDTKGLRELLGDALAPYEKESPVVQLRVKPTEIFREAAE
jgi:predicted phage-related endonuclease